MVKWWRRSKTLQAFEVAKVNVIFLLVRSLDARFRSTRNSFLPEMSSVLSACLRVRLIQA